MNAAEARALAAIRGYALANRVRFTRHAWRRMNERGATEDDVRHALSTALACSAQPNETWKVPSKDADGEDLTTVVALEDSALVVTVF